MPTARSSSSDASIRPLAGWRARVDGLALAILILVVVGSALALAGTVISLFLPLAVLTIAGALAAALFSPTRSKIAALPGVVLAGLGVVCLVQSIPLPIGWLQRLSPATADVWARSLLPVKQQVAYGALSFDPSASTVEAVKWVTYGATFYLAALASRRRGAAVPLAIVFATALLVALVSLAHAALGATTVYGFYPLSQHGAVSYVGPFLNANALAGYLNLGALVGAGLLLARTPIAPRWLLGAGVICVVAVSIRTASRGGIASLIIGFAFLAIAVALVRGTNRVSARVVAYTFSGLLLVGALLAVIGSDAVFWAELLNENTEKLRLPAHSVPLIKDHAWFGIGRGAFESVFQAYRPTTEAHVVFTHPENFVVQWLAEWGLPVALLATGALTWCFWPWRLGIRRSVLAAAAFCGLFALLLQNLVDLGLELPAVGIAFATVLGALWGGAPARRSLAFSRTSRLRLALALGMMLGLAAAALALIRGPATVREDRALVRRLLERRSRDDSEPVSRELHEAVISMSARHPADYYFPLAGAMAARMEGDNPMPWLQRALERGPTIGRTHFLLAEVLGDYGFTRQAMGELRLAISYEPWLAYPAAPTAVRLTKDTETLLLAVPDGPHGGPLLDQLGQLMADPSARERFDTEALSRDATLIGPRQRLVDARLAALKDGSALCADIGRCLTEIEAHAAAFEKHASQGTRATRARAGLAIATGDIVGAVRLLEAGCNAPQERSECFSLLVEVLSKQPSSDDALAQALDAYTDATCAEAKGCAHAHQRAGDVRNGRGERQGAVSSYEKAARAEPSVARWLMVADAAHGAGLAVTEAKALEQALRLQPGDAALEVRVKEARARERRPP